MKDIAISIKTAEGYKSLAGIKQGKYGPQAYLTPEGHKALKEWLNAPAAYLNLNIKEFEPKGTQSNSNEAPF